MNRPRNRQPRPPRPNNNPSPAPRPGASPNYQQRAKTVPTVNQVSRGSAVAIVLKQDQGSGRETEGLVQDLLTRGNHPRGIKVRLQDGQIGRVQRMLNSPPTPAASVHGPQSGGPVPGRFSSRYSDMRADDDAPSEPPPRTLADYMPVVDEGQAANWNDQRHVSPHGIVKCPICGDFEGDEVAVSHHVERHFS